MPFAYRLGEGVGAYWLVIRSADSAKKDQQTISKLRQHGASSCNACQDGYLQPSVIGMLPRVQSGLSQGQRNLPWKHFRTIDIASHPPYVLPKLVLGATCMLCADLIGTIYWSSGYGGCG